ARTSSAVASSAGRTATSTPSISSSFAPSRTASVSRRIEPVGEWCTTNNRAMRHRLGGGPAEALVQVTQLGRDGVEPVAVGRLELGQDSREQSVGLGQGLLERADAGERHGTP